MTGSEIITRRRKWKSAEKAALLAEVEAEGGKVVVVARRHRSNLCHSGYSDRTRTGRGSLSWRRRSANDRNIARPAKAMPE